MIHSNIDQSAGRIDITFYTDPLCCWSFGFEQHWRRLKEHLGDTLHTRYCMTGMLESWNSYNDALNSVSKPIQMGPVWMQASQVCGVEIDGNIWVKDPPASSYVACMAVKCAFRQSFAAGEKYLNHIRTALMQKGINTSRQSTLVSLAKEIDILDIREFAHDLSSGTGLHLFQNDLSEARYRNISRSPTLIIHNADKAVVLTGYREYDSVLQAIKGLVPEQIQTPQD